MTIRPAIVQVLGELMQLPDGDSTNNPENATFTYTAGKLTQIDFDNGTVTFTYSGGKLQTVTSTYTGKTLTFAYSGGNLSTITVS
jgi:hypothetical protein